MRYREDIAGDDRIRADLLADALYIGRVKRRLNSPEYSSR